MAPDACNDCFYYRPNDNLNQRLGRLLVQNNGLPEVIYIKFIWLWRSPRMSRDMDTCDSDPYYVDGSGQFCYSGVTALQGTKDARASIRSIHHGRYFSGQ